MKAHHECTVTKKPNRALSPSSFLILRERRYISLEEQMSRRMLGANLAPCSLMQSIKHTTARAADAARSQGSACVPNSHPSVSHRLAACGGNVEAVHELVLLHLVRAGRLRKALAAQEGKGHGDLKKKMQWLDTSASQANHWHCEGPLTSMPLKQSLRLVVFPVRRVLRSIEPRYVCVFSGYRSLTWPYMA